jgi:N-carbamoylputrescine amidase
MARRHRRNRVVVALVQMQAEKRPEANLAKALARIEGAARAGARIVCLQELFRSHYFPQVEDARRFKLAEPVPGPTTEALGRVAAARRIVIVGSVFERRAPGIYHNTAVVIDADGSLAGKYRKTHLPDDPGYYEKFYFSPGDLGFPSFRTAYASVAALVCWDQWFPEAARLAALNGAEILFYPTAIGWLAGEPRALAAAEREAWELVQRSHAVANGIFVAAVNRVGREGRLRFWGGSFVADPWGRIVARAEEREQTVVAECDLSQIEEFRQTWPFLRDRRVELYERLAKRFKDEG